MWESERRKLREKINSKPGLNIAGDLWKVAYEEVKGFMIDMVIELICGLGAEATLDLIISCV